MNINLVSYSDISGGAARAAYRLHCNLQTVGHSSRMSVQKKVSDDYSVVGPVGNVGKLFNLSRSLLGKWVVKLQKSENPIIHTVSWYPFAGCGGFNRKLGPVDIVNLHWIRDIPVIECIALINKPVVWTLHDMWAFCGAEHYAPDDDQARWRTGYTDNNRPLSDRGLDIDRWTWERKKRHWPHPLHIITPSSWLGECVSQSFLMHDWPVHIIPNVLDTEAFKPLNKAFARQALNLPQDKKLILFGALKGSEDPRKGFDLLQDALVILGNSGIRELHGVIFGQSKPLKAPEIGFPVQWMGYIYDEWTLALLYSAADVMVVPSRQENLPQTGTEAQACGCPVVAFNSTGLPDVVVHKRTGYLARPFDVKDLAQGISWVLQDKKKYERLCIAARERAVRLWAPEIVIPQYLDVYQMAIEQYRKIKLQGM